MKGELFQAVEAHSGELIELADYIYDQAECGCEEYNSQQALCNYLERNGFAVEKGIGGLPTAFKATYTSLNGGPRIGLLCEYDALYGIGHACGHHMQGPSALGAAVALKDTLSDRLGFDLVVYGCPDEEGHAFGGKIVMVENGCFNDIDVAIIMHGGTETTTDLRTLASTSYRVTFSNPDVADKLDASPKICALDGMLMAFEGIEFLREHILDSSRIHYTYWPDQGNEDSFVSEYSVRAMTLHDFENMKQRFEAIVSAAAEMTGAKVHIQIQKEYKPKIPIQTLVDSFYENARLVDAPQIEGPRKRVGSSDFANVQFKVPGIGIRIAFAPKGTSAHSAEWLARGKEQVAHDAVICAAKTMAAMALDLIQNPQKLTKAKQELEAERELLLRPTLQS